MSLSMYQSINIYIMCDQVSQLWIRSLETNRISSMVQNKPHLLVAPTPAPHITEISSTLIGWCCTTNVHGTYVCRAHTHAHTYERYTRTLRTYTTFEKVLVLCSIGAYLWSYARLGLINFAFHISLHAKLDAWLAEQYEWSMSIVNLNQSKVRSIWYTKKS